MGVLLSGVALDRQMNQIQIRVEERGGLTKFDITIFQITFPFPFPFPFPLLLHLLEILIRAILEGYCPVEWVLRQTYGHQESTEDLEDDGTEADVADHT